MKHRLAKFLYAYIFIFMVNGDVVRDAIILRDGWMIHRNVRDSLVHFGYELVRISDGVLLAEGETTHIVTDSQMKVRAIPEKYMKVFQGAIKQTL